MVGELFLMFFHPFSVIIVDLIFLLKSSGQVGCGKVEPPFQLLCLFFGSPEYLPVFGGSPLPQLKQFIGIVLNLFLEFDNFYLMFGFHVFDLCFESRYFELKFLSLNLFLIADPFI